MVGEQSGVGTGCWFSVPSSSMQRSMSASYDWLYSVEFLQNCFYFGLSSKSTIARFEIQHLRAGKPLGTIVARALA